MSDRTAMIAAIVGPTSVGKTSVSIGLARELSAEIVSVDSRQIYREIVIGTAKPSDDDLAAVRHHFISERSINEPITAAEYAAEARSRITEIESRGKNILLVGGSTLYLHALLFGLDDVPRSDPDVRKHLQARLDTEGLFALVSDLAIKDPVSYERIDRDNPRRVLRALEVYETTGRPMSSFQTGTHDDLLHGGIVVLNRERADLYRRINRRAVSMVDQGLVDEIKVLLEAGFSPDLQALQTIGYNEVLQHLAGDLDERELVDLIARNTRRYAKRQLTWFRRYRGFEWLEVAEDESVDDISRRAFDRLQRH